MNRSVRMHVSSSRAAATIWESDTLDIMDIHGYHGYHGHFWICMDMDMVDIQMDIRNTYP